MRKARNYCWILAGLLAGCTKSGTSTNDNNGNWVTMSEFANKPRSEAVAFTIGDTTYIGTGYDGEKNLRDFLKYNNNGWSQIADLPADAAARSSAVAMVIGGKGYVGTGFDGNYRLDDFWQYDPATGSWLRRKSLTSPNPSISLARRDAVAFAVKGKGYIATGNDGGALKDVWQYDPGSDSWTEKKTFGGSKRTEAVAFVIGDSAYIATGTNNGELKNDFWVYNPDKDDWTEKRKIANVSDEDYDNDYDIVRSNAIAFVMNNKAYVATGSKGGLAQDCWEYNPVTDLWKKKQDFKGVARTGAVGFTLKGQGYLGLGRTASLQLDNLFRFDPDATYNKND